MKVADWVDMFPMVGKDEAEIDFYDLLQEPVPGKIDIFWRLLSESVISIISQAKLIRVSPNLLVCAIAYTLLQERFGYNWVFLSESVICRRHSVIHWMLLSESVICRRYPVIHGLSLSESVICRK